MSLKLMCTNTIKSDNKYSNNSEKRTGTLDNFQTCKF